MSADLTLDNLIQIEDPAPPIIRQENGDIDIAAYGIDQLFLYALKLELPSFLYANVRIYLNVSDEAGKLGGFFIETIEESEKVQEIHVPFSLHDIAAAIYVYCRQLRDLEWIEIEDQYPLDMEYIHAIELMLKEGKAKDKIKSFTEGIISDTYWRNYISQRIDLYLILHELMHAFLFRIYPLNLDTYPDSKEVQETMELGLETEKKLYKVIESYGFTLDIDSTEIEILSVLNKRLMKWALDPLNNIFTRQEIEDSFALLYITGIQEVWARLIEVRVAIAKQSEADAKGIFESRSTYKKGSEIVKAVVDGYIASSIMIPTEALVELYKQDELTAEWIDNYIKKWLIPLMDRDVIEEKRKELLITY